MRSTIIEADSRGRLPSVSFDLSEDEDSERAIAFCITGSGHTFRGDPMLTALYFEQIVKSLIALHNAESLASCQGYDVEQTGKVLSAVPLAHPGHEFWYGGLGL